MAAHHRDQRVSPVRHLARIARLAVSESGSLIKVASLWLLGNSVAVGLLLGAVAVPAAQAHMVDAQHGTLNLVNTGGFVVVSVPVRAFQNVDDDADDRLSMAELRRHAKDISAQVGRGLQLISEQGPIEIQGLMLNLSPDARTPTAPASHLVVMGRFPWAAGTIATTGSQRQPSRLRLRFSLFSQTAESQRQIFIVRHGSRTQKIEMTPDRQIVGLMPGPWQVLRDNVLLGAEHVLGGLDHLLFLLVVLTTGWRWRVIVLVLTTFTVGHAISLGAVIYAGFEVPAFVVEPAIAATIIGLALYDRWSEQRAKPLEPAWRLGLVFGCALIHGLGLANALSSLGLDPSSRMLSLVGFNLGIEAAQLLVALAFGMTVGVLNGMRAPDWTPVASRLVSHFAILMGSVWLVHRALIG